MRQNGDLVGLYVAHRAALVDYASGIVGNRTHAEDVVQEAWLRLSDAHEQTQIREPLRYIYRIVRNLAVDVLRRNAQEGANAGIDMDVAARLLPDATPSPERIAIDRADMRRVAAALDELPERQRVAVEMYGVHGCKLREIAAHLGVSISLVHALIADGLAHCDRRRNGGGGR